MFKARYFAASCGALSLLLSAGAANAFCGFYVAKADTKIFNKASKVVIARNDGKTVISMVNDYQGAPKEFAMVVPVPTVLKREQIHVTENKIIDHLDAYTAPRLVEYFDKDPCRLRPIPRFSSGAGQPPVAMSAAGRARANALGVKIEAEYTVGEYDILILSAAQSSGLKTWLVENGYRLPPGVEPILAEYLRKGMKFFVARVNLTEKKKLGFTYLRPLQIAFNSANFMLPIRLGMVNADGPQELFILMLTRKGRVETTNYRTVRMPSNMNVPIFVKQEFGKFYSAMFDRQVKKEDGRAVFLEYAWDMGWCDPCAADPLSVRELRELGVFWQADRGRPGAVRRRRGRARDVYVTRLHVRYDAEHFPDDLVFRETEDRKNFQGRYILRHPYKGPATCDAAERYFGTLPARFEKEAQTLASLTDWPIDTIRRKMKRGGQPSPSGEKTGTTGEWWRKIWREEKRGR